MPELEEQRADPCILPVNKASNSIAFYKKVRRINVPMPKGGGGELLVLGEKIWYNA